MFFRLLSEHMAWFFENKKSMKKVLQSAKDYKKVIEKIHKGGQGHREAEEAVLGEVGCNKREE